jgi:hypothetical protein
MSSYLGISQVNMSVLINTGKRKKSFILQKPSVETVKISQDRFLCTPSKYIIIIALASRGRSKASYGGVFRFESLDGV